MIRRSISIAAVTVTAFAASAYAFGGWAAITVADLPDHFEVGKATTFTFMIRQHGHAPLPNLHPVLEAKSGGMLGGATIDVNATATKTVGEYTAALTVPKAGDWRVTIKSGFGRSDLQLNPIQAVDAGKTFAAVAEIDRGRHLFVAKGCVMCHQRADVDRGESQFIESGPNLTDRQLDPAYLALWLANPAIRPPTQPGVEMPNLGLSKTEVAALTKFITGGKSTAATKQ